MSLSPSAIVKSEKRERVDDSSSDDDEFDFGAFHWIAPRLADPAAPDPDPNPPVAIPPVVTAPARTTTRQSNGAGSVARAGTGFAPWARSNVSMLIAKHRRAASRVEFNAAVRGEWRALDGDAQQAFARLHARQQRAARHNRANSHALCK